MNSFLETQTKETIWQICMQFSKKKTFQANEILWDTAFVLVMILSSWRDLN